MKASSLPADRGLHILAALIICLALAAPLHAHGRPESCADLVEQVSPAVVFISTTKTVKRGPMPDLFQFHGRGQSQPDGEGVPEEIPDLPEFFRRFFGGPGGQMPRDFKQRGQGSGVIVDKAGFILTNNHVVSEADEILVAVKGMDKLKAEIVGRDKKTDLALIRVKAPRDLPLAPLGDSEALRVGDWVMAVGNPFGLESTVTAGIISAKGRIIGAGPYDDFLQTDASINFGNSGGPLVNMKGEVVGINTAIFAQGQGIGFAIPSNLAREVMNQLRTKGRVVRGWLGVMIQPVTKDLADKLRLKEAEGLLVGDVTKDSPADKAGLRRGDLILEFKGKALKETHALSRQVAETAVGSEAKLRVAREGKTRNVNVTIGELREEATAAAKAEPAEKVRLGLTLQELTPELTASLGVSVKKGLVVTGVESGGPADEAGLKRMDVILEAAQKPVAKVEDLAALAGKLSPGEGLLLLVQRRDATMFVVVNAPEKR